MIRARILFPKIVKEAKVSDRIEVNRGHDRFKPPSFQARAPFDFQIGNPPKIEVTLGKEVL